MTTLSTLPTFPILYWKDVTEVQPLAFAETRAPIPSSGLPQSLPGLAWTISSWLVCK